MIKVVTKGSHSKTTAFLTRMQNREHLRQLEKFGPVGVEALAKATPKDSGLSANSWTYSITQKPGYYAITWHNTDTENGAPVAVLVQYGHATKNGGYVQGRDFINPAMRPIFDKIAADMWKVVTK